MLNPRNHLVNNFRSNGTWRAWRRTRPSAPRSSPSPPWTRMKVWRFLIISKHFFALKICSSHFLPLSSLFFSSLSLLTPPPLFLYLSSFPSPLSLLGSLISFSLFLSPILFFLLCFYTVVGGVITLNDIKCKTYHCSWPG